MKYDLNPKMGFFIIKNSLCKISNFDVFCDVSQNFMTNIFFRIFCRASMPFRGRFLPYFGKKEKIS